MDEKTNVTNENVTEENVDKSESLAELFREKLQEQYNRGLQAGIMVVSKVVLDKLADNSKPLMKRIVDVKKFCKVPWGKSSIDAMKKANDEIEAETEKEAETTAESAEQNQDE